MQIDVKGSAPVLEEFSRVLCEFLKKSGYNEGPRFGRMGAESGRTFARGEQIVALDLVEAETGESVLHLEAEGENAELEAIWDDSLIAFRRELLSWTQRAARNSKKVEQAL